MEGCRGTYLHADQTSYLKLRTSDHTGWCRAKALHSYSGGIPFESLQGQQLSWQVFRVFLMSLDANTGIVLRLGQNHCFLPNLFKFIIHESSYNSMF
jgi:hypothetical protein